MAAVLWSVGCLLVLAVGLPVDGWTWAVVLGVTAWSATAGPGQRLRALTPILLIAYHIFLFYSMDELFDTRGGRRGVRFWPTGLAFAQHGPNTRLLERSLGPLPPEWRHGWKSINPLFGSIRDGDERVHQYSVIFREYLPDALARLPSDAARKQVLHCLTEPKNLLRVHQGLLLVCLKDWGYPPGMDAVSWWERHRPLFRVECDARQAVLTVAGWTALLMERPELPNDIRSQARVAEYQEWRGWGADPEFRRTFIEMMGGDLPFHGPHLRAGVKNVVWWHRP